MNHYVVSLIKEGVGSEQQTLLFVLDFVSLTNKQKMETKKLLNSTSKNRGKGCTSQNDYSEASEDVAQFTASKQKQYDSPPFVTKPGLK